MLPRKKPRMLHGGQALFARPGEDHLQLKQTRSNAKETYNGFEESDLNGIIIGCHLSNLITFPVNLKIWKIRTMILLLIVNDAIPMRTFPFQSIRH